MRRWHQERDLMLRRWRKELNKHGDSHPHSEYHWQGPYDSLVPPAVACEVNCHCANGIGTMRKNRLDCGKARCEVCHCGKWFPKSRANKKRAAIQHELDAERRTS